MTRNRILIGLCALALLVGFTAVASAGQTVSSRKGGSVSCQLTNETPIAHGPSNTVDVTCTTPSGSGQSTNAVVNVTGPED